MFSVLLVCFGELVRLMGWGIVRGEREREGGLKRRKKVLRIGTGFSY